MNEAKVMLIPAAKSLDAVTVFWQDFGPNKGQVTILCWGSAWTCYFGGMGEDATIEQFFAKASTSYLVNKLGITKWLKQSKLHDRYLGTLIEAIKAELKK